ncbi:MAG: hypothetical protein RSA49_04175 [Anaerovoracaceae bacterium]|uniref:hypothetical protein n=1 Tax=Chryseobacterium sp. TaxID=1871047 RepID=UPI002FC88E87
MWKVGIEYKDGVRIFRIYETIDENKSDTAFNRRYFGELFSTMRDAEKYATYLNQMSEKKEGK